MDFYPKPKWQYSTLTCPQCSSLIIRDYKWHEKCRKLKVRHLHVKCFCDYEFGVKGNADA